MSWEFLGVAAVSLWKFLLAMGNLELAKAPTIPVITLLMPLMIAPCIISCLTHFVSI